MDGLGNRSIFYPPFIYQKKAFFAVFSYIYTISGRIATHPCENVLWFIIIPLSLLYRYDLSQEASRGGAAAQAQGNCALLWSGYRHFRM